MLSKRVLSKTWIGFITYVWRKHLDRTLLWSPTSSGFHTLHTLQQHGKKRVNTGIKRFGPRVLVAATEIWSGALLKLPEQTKNLTFALKTGCDFVADSETFHKQCLQQTHHKAQTHPAKSQLLTPRPGRVWNVGDIPIPAGIVCLFPANHRCAEQLSTPTEVPDRENCLLGS